MRLPSLPAPPAPLSWVWKKSCLVTIAKTGDTKWKKGMTYMTKNENKNHTPLRGRVWDQVKIVRDESVATLYILSIAWNSDG